MNDNEKIENYEAANQAASELGYDDFNSASSEIKKSILDNSVDNPTAEQVQNRNKAIQRASVLISSLVQKVLYMELTNMSEKLPNHNDDLLSYFDDGFISYGNSKEYVRELETGTETYDITKYIPETVTKPQFDPPKMLSMYQQNGSLAAGAYQFKKRISLTPQVWLPYFLNGNLSKYISDLRASIRKTYKIYLFDKIATLLASATPKTVIDDQTSGNMLECITKLGMEVNSMLYQTSDYNYDANSVAINWGSSKDDYIYIFPNRFLTAIQGGVFSQLYNPELIMGEKGIIPKNNVYSLGKKFSVPNDISTPISVNAAYYLDANSVLVLSKNAIKHLRQIEVYEEQKYSNNMVTEIVMHAWGVIGILPFEQFMKYSGKNLYLLPNGQNMGNAPITRNKATK